MNKQLLAATFLAHIDHGNIVYKDTSFTSLNLLDTVYYRVLRFLTGTSLSSCKLLYWYKLVCKYFLGLLTTYLSFITFTKLNTNKT